MPRNLDMPDRSYVAIPAGFARIMVLNTPDALLAAR